MRDLYYKIDSNGYHIYDRNNEFFHVHQPEPYIPDPNKSYEENAQMQIKNIITSDYARLVFTKLITIEEVPEEYREGAAIIAEQFERISDKQNI